MSPLATTCVYHILRSTYLHISGSFLNSSFVLVREMFCMRWKIEPVLHTHCAYTLSTAETTWFATSSLPPVRSCPDTMCAGRFSSDLAVLPFLARQTPRRKCHDVNSRGNVCWPVRDDAIVSTTLYSTEHSSRESHLLQLLQTKLIKIILARVLVYSTATCR